MRLGSYRGAVRYPYLERDGGSASTIQLHNMKD